MGARASLFATLRRIAGTAFELLELRLELLSTELEQEKQRVVGGLAWAALALVLVGVALLTAVLWVVLWVGDAHRLQTLAALTVVFFVAALATARAARQRLASRGGPFALTRAELRQDRDSLSAKPNDRTDPPPPTASP